MNKEFVYLDDCKFLVTDQDGHISIRTDGDESIKNKLLLENAIEEIDKLILNLENQEKTVNNISLPLREKILFYGFPVWAAALVSAILSLVDVNILANIYPSLIVGTGVCTALIDGLFIYGNKNATKVNKARHSKLRRAYELKSSLGKKLEKIRINDCTNKRNVIEKNNIYSLDNNPFYDEMISELAIASKNNEKVRKRKLY